MKFETLQIHEFYMYTTASKYSCLTQRANVVIHTHTGDELLVFVILYQNVHARASRVHGMRKKQTNTKCI